VSQRRVKTEESSAPPLTYRDAGVDIGRTAKALELVKPMIRSTFTHGVATDIGTFGAMFALKDLPERDALLCSSVDSVGTKVMVASMMNRHDTVGQDLVNHCVNDILVQGARPLFFMDYIAAARLDPPFVEQLISGLTTACREVNCALIGGEMAELPGMYQEGEYDLVGFVAGVVERNKALAGDCVRPGDVLLGLSSNGLHTNGYSLARKLFFEVAGLPVTQHIPQLGLTIGEELLRIHRCYTPAVLPLLDDVEVKAMAHITGGGLPDNLVRAMPEGCAAVIDRGSWKAPAIFDLIQDLGRVADEEMYHTFNMGVGYVLVVDEIEADRATRYLTARGETVSRLGRVEAGEREVRIV
jgi:phosphoribosylformylglycinamidine cyclo-ligase